MNSLFLRSSCVLLCFLFFGFLKFGYATTSHREQEEYRFKEPALWAGQFDAPSRDKWQKPQTVIQALQLKPGQTVVDIGAGTGYFAVKFARVVGPQGKVLALDRELSMVKYLKKRAKKEGLNNLIVRKSPTNNPELEKQSVDLIFFCNSYHHIHNPNYLKALAEALKKDGKIAVIDIKPHAPRLFPATARFKRHIKLSAQAVVEDFQHAGFSLDKESRFLPYQYFLEFKPTLVPSR